jgi:hypothetical protein
MLTLRPSGTNNNLLKLTRLPSSDGIKEVSRLKLKSSNAVMHKGTTSIIRYINSVIQPKNHLETLHMKRT